MKNKYLKKIVDKIKKDRTYKIVFCGDSITSTEWVHPNFREIIEYVLKDYLGFVMRDWKTPSWNIRCFNAALDGGASKDILDRLDDYVLIHKPQMLILQGTRCDLEQKVKVSMHVKNISSIIKKSIEKEIDVVFCGTTPTLYKKKNEEYSSYIQKAAEIAKKNKIPYVDLFNKFQEFNLQKIFTFISEGNEEEGIKPGEIDPEHPNALGNAYIAKILLKEIFGIEFDPELYIKETLAGKKYPKY